MVGVSMEKIDWLNIVNEVYGTNATSMEEISVDSTVIEQRKVVFRDVYGKDWAHYSPQTGELVGNNGCILLRGVQEPCWLGEEFTHENTKDSVISKGSWQCVYGLLNNIYGHTIIVHGLAPKSVICAFVEWQPGAAKYASLAGDYENMKRLFEDD